MTDRKYEITDIRHPRHRFLRRIRALRSFLEVEEGDLGGYIQAERNLSHEGFCWVSNDALVSGNAQVYDDAQVFENAIVSGNARVYNGASVYGRARVSGDAQVYHAARVYDDAHVYGQAQVLHGAGVYGAAKVYGYAQVHCQGQVYGDACVSGYAEVCDGGRVCGNANVDGTAHIGEYWVIKFDRLSRTPTVADLIRCGMGICVVNGVVRLYKRVRGDFRSEYNADFIYPESGVVECHDYDPYPLTSCGKGLHFSHAGYGTWVSNANSKILAADIHIDDIICVQDGKVRCKRATIVGVVDTG